MAKTCGGPRGPFIGRYEPYMTPNDEAKGYPETKEHLRGMGTDELIREYLEMSRASFNRLFGHNAARAANLVVEELHARRCKSIPNIFGPIPIKKVER